MIGHVGNYRGFQVLITGTSSDDCGYEVSAVGEILKRAEHFNDDGRAMDAACSCIDSLLSRKRTDEHNDERDDK